VLIAVPGAAWRTDAPPDAEASGSELSTESDGVEPPFGRESATLASSEDSVGVEGPAVFSVVVDDGGAESAPDELPSSAHATAGLLATATPTPNATANPPTRPTKRPALMTALPDRIVRCEEPGS
jgi:hypothetical protein